MKEQLIEQLSIKVNKVFDIFFVVVDLPIYYTEVILL